MIFIHMCIIIAFSFLFLISVHGQSVVIQSADIQFKGYFEGQPVKLNVVVKNTGTANIIGCWLEVKIYSNFWMGHIVREGWWQNIPFLGGGQILILVMI